MSSAYPVTTEKMSLQKVITITFQNGNILLTLPSTANGPLNVFFKLPITEIISVDDHRRVRKIIEPVLTNLYCLGGEHNTWIPHEVARA